MKILLIYSFFVLSIYRYHVTDALSVDGFVNASDYEQKFDRIFQEYWKQNRTVTEDLTTILDTPNAPGLKLVDIPNSLFPKKCLICRAFTYSMLQYYRNELSDANLNEYLYELCTVLAKIHDYECNGIVNIYAPTIKYILMNRNDQLTSDRICGILFQYNECSEKKDHISFVIEMRPQQVNINIRNCMDTTSTFLDGDDDDTNLIDSSYCLINGKLNEQPMEQQQQQHKSVPPLVIGHLSDFHYDRYYAPGSSSNCQDFICCRNTSIPKTNSTETAGYWGDYNSCDSPGYIVENICSQVAENHKNIDIIYYTGDFADHFGWLTTKDIVKHSIEFITSQIKEKFPNKPVAMVIGNHDIHPSDAFAPNDTLDNDAVGAKWLYEYVADLWSNWLPQSALTTLRSGGYYTFVVRSGLRIIVLNNNLCFCHNVWLVYGVDDMIIQLEWLRDTLIEAELNGEKCHILGHVPPNTSSCIRAWNREYNKIVQRFAHIISGQFNGHTHNDEFTLYYRENSTEAINVAWNGGSGTTFIGLNSNYRLYEIDGSTFNVIDHETWIFNLTKANFLPNQTPEWYREYSFRDAYGVPDLLPKTLSHLVNDTFRHDKNALQRFWNFKMKMADPKLLMGCDDACLERTRQETNGDIEYNFFQ